MPSTPIGEVGEIMAEEQQPTQSQGLGDGSLPLPAPPAEAEKYIAREIERCRTWSFHGQRMWSFLTHGATISIAVLSACAAVLAQHPVPVAAFELLGIDYSGKNIATILSLLVTIITTLQTKLAFERKWIANRMTQSTMTRLSVDAHMRTTTPADLAQQYKAALETHDKAITGAS